MTLTTILLWAGLATLANAQTANIDIPYSTSTAPLIIRAAARHYGANEKQLLNTLWCESQFSADAIGDHHTSYGIAQIHLPAHQELSKAQALDPIFSIDWAAQQFAKGHQHMWSCNGDTTYERLFET